MDLLDPALEVFSKSNIKTLKRDAKAVSKIVNRVYLSMQWPALLATAAASWLILFICYRASLYIHISTIKDHPIKTFFAAIMGIPLFVAAAHNFLTVTAPSISRFINADADNPVIKAKLITRSKLSPEVKAALINASLSTDTPITYDALIELQEKMFQKISTAERVIEQVAAERKAVREAEKLKSKRKAKAEKQKDGFLNDR